MLVKIFVSTHATQAEVWALAHASGCVFNLFYFNGFFHYYKIGLCSRSFVPVTFGPGTKGDFCPGSKRAGDRGLLSRVEPPTGTKDPPFVPVGGSTRDKRSNPFYPGW